MRNRIFASVVPALLAATLSISAYAQDSRNRTVGTIVQDVLAIVPIQTADQLSSEIGSLAAVAPESVTMLASMLKNASEGVNSRAEYALNALANYASDPANAACRNRVLEGFKSAVESCSDAVNKAFLESQLRLVACDEAAIPVSDVPQYAERVAPVVKPSRFKRLPENEKCNTLYWIGELRDSSQLDLVLKYVDAGGPVGMDAMTAASKIGGDRVVNVLLDRALYGKDTDAAISALNSTPSDIVPAVLARTGEVGRSSDSVLLDIIGMRRITAASGFVFDCLGSPDKDVAASAARNLSGVVTAADMPRVAKLYDGASDPISVDNFGLAYLICAGKSENPTARVLGDMSSAANPDRFLQALASTNSDEAADCLVSRAAENRSEEMLAALEIIDNYKVAPTLLECAADRPSLLSHYADLVSKHEIDWQKYDAYHKALETAAAIDAPAEVVNDVIYTMSGSPCAESFSEIAQYMDRAETSFTAAEAVRHEAPAIVSTTDYAVLESVLGKARELYSSWSSKGNADAGYAVDEIDKLLAESKPYVTVLSDGELREGFRLLFDGTDMSQWEGDIDGYKPLNGALYVSTNFGGNIYTRKEYRNFVLRFEFCFLVPAVNNGVGIRTPEGVDAAYDGMCEVQILDHDDPCYSWLNPYQVHGSVYGVIPAKRIVHKPLGEWGTEEIVVNGENIKVTVNGEVVLEGNVREACSGHNVAPDGSGDNPYTADHQNHPGLFNKKGHISFCGHGSGLKLRNIRLREIR